MKLIHCNNVICFRCRGLVNNNAIRGTKDCVCNKVDAFFSKAPQLDVTPFTRMLLDQHKANSENNTKQ